MKNRARVFRSLLVGVLIGAVVLAVLPITGTTASNKNREELYKKLGVFTQALTYIEKNYVKEVDPQKLIYGAIKGMVAELDPHTTFMSPDFYKEMEVETKGEFGGLGIEITIKNGVLTIVSPIEGTPAYKKGLKAGDRIIAIEGNSTRGLSLMEAVKRLRGKKGTKVTITIQRDEMKPFDVTIVRDIIKVKSVSYRMEDPKAKIGYVRIRSFQERTSKQLDAALKALDKQGMRALVLDLRNNPGGLLSQAVGVSDRFLGKGKLVVSIKGRNGANEVKFMAHEDHTFPFHPMVVLVNAGSASASEIVAGALQDWRRAVIVGERTFGKGSVQTVYPLSDGSALKLTTAAYYTPLGRSIQEEGIIPDVQISSDITEKAGGNRTVIREESLKHHFAQGVIKPEKKSKKQKPSVEAKLKDYQLKYALQFLKGWLLINNEEIFGGAKTAKK